MHSLSQALGKVKGFEDNIFELEEKLRYEKEERLNVVADMEEEIRQLEMDMEEQELIAKQVCPQDPGIVVQPFVLLSVISLSHLPCFLLPCF